MIRTMILATALLVVATAQADEARREFCGHAAAVYVESLYLRDTGAKIGYALKQSEAHAQAVPLAARKDFINQVYFGEAFRYATAAQVQREVIISCLGLDPSPPDAPLK